MSKNHYRASLQALKLEYRRDRKCLAFAISSVTLLLLTVRIQGYDAWVSSSGVCAHEVS
jgi:hypothetical protein